MLRSIAVLCVLVLVSSARPAERTHDITVDDYFSIDVILQHAISPDGDAVAFTLARWYKETNDRKADLWIVETASKKVRRLTFDRANDAQPRWSPDGKSIYFLGRRKREGEKQPPYDNSTQVWRIGREGGDALAITRVPGGVHGYELAPDGKAVHYLTHEDKTVGEFAELKKKYKDAEYGYGTPKASKLHKLDLETWRSSVAPDDVEYIREFKLSPDGKRVALIAAPDDTVVASEGRSYVTVVDLETRKATPVPRKLYRDDMPSPYAWLEGLTFAADSKTVAFNVIFDGYPPEIMQGKERLERPKGYHLRGYGGPIHWSPTGELIFLGEQRGRVRLCRTKNGEAGWEELTPGDVVVESFSASQDCSRFSVVMNDTQHTPDLFLVSMTGKKPALQRLTNINPQVDDWKIPSISTVEWKSKDGSPVEGILELPPSYKKGDKVPLIVEIHGGPTSATRYHLQYWIYGRTLLPAKGYAILSPNYRGSVGYGDKFLTELVGRENDLDVADILSGVDALVERGIADPDRLGVMGWSNGGYLTNCIITHTTRFKAASSGAGIVDTVTEWGTNDEPAYAIVFKRGFPWDKADLYKKTSPTYALDKVRTPTLIHVGANDERCPPGHSRMLHRALKEYVKVPTELLIYPGEPHGLMKYGSRKAKMEWDVAWFDKYIMKTKPQR